MNCRSIIMIGCLGVVSIIAILGGISYWIITQYGWYGVIGIIGFTLIMYLSFKIFIGNIFLIPFIIKGNALKGASITFTKIIKLGPSPKEEVNDGQDSVKYDYEVEFTITPRKGNRFYDVGEILVVDEQSKISFKDDPTENDIGHFMEIFIRQGDEWNKEFDKVIGKQSFKGILRCEQRESVKFQYYFNFIGKVKLPSDEPRQG